MTKLINRIAVAIIFTIMSISALAQTTFTESAALPAYNLDISGGKDGGHAWADYDLDGDFDLVINTNGRGYLLRNDGASGFTDITASLAPDFLNHSLERTALFVDFNNDGYPDVFRNDNVRIKIYLQDPVTHRFGNGTGGVVPNQTFTTLTDGMNAEGAGALDYDGDGDFRDAQSEADLSLTKTVNNASPNQGDNITFTLTINNAGPSAPINIIVKDIIPTDFTYTHPNFSTTQGAVTYNVVTREFEWNLGAYVLASGNNITLTYTVTVNVCGEFTNQAEITNSSLTDPDSTPNNGN